MFVEFAFYLKRCSVGWKFVFGFSSWESLLELMRESWLESQLGVPLVGSAGVEFLTSWFRSWSELLFEVFVLRNVSGTFPLFHVFQDCKLENRFQAKRKTLCRVKLVSS